VCKSVDDTRLEHDTYISKVVKNRTMRKVCHILANADRFLRGSEEQKEGYRLAMPEITKFLDAEPEHEAALNLKARILVVLDEPIEAIKIVKGIDGWDAEFISRYCLAEAYEALGLWKQADDEYRITCALCQQAMDCCDFATRSFLGMSRVAHQMKNYEHSVHLMEHLIQRERRVLGAHKLLALSLLAMAKSSTTTELVL
jgi:lipopolysaccharide biosynthesis regulator YciM